jgi:hypothetical protein
MDGFVECNILPSVFSSFAVYFLFAECFLCVPFAVHPFVRQMFLFWYSAYHVLSEFRAAHTWQKRKHPVLDLARNSMTLDRSTEHVLLWIIFNCVPFFHHCLWPYFNLSFLQMGCVKKQLHKQNN